MRERLRSFAADESGTTAIEYAIAIVIVSVLIIATLNWLGAGITEVFDLLATGFE